MWTTPPCSVWRCASIVDGTWGFAADAELDPAAAERAAQHAVRVARALRALNRDPVVLADEPVYRDAEWVSHYLIDPFAIPDADKVAQLLDYSERLSAADGVDHVTARLMQVKEQSYYADSFGSRITQQRVRLNPDLEAIRVDQSAGAFETMRTLTPPAGRGWEFVTGADGVWDWDAELAAIPEWLAEKAEGPASRPARPTW